MEMKGSLSFEDFAMMCQFVGIDTPKKELKRTFDIVDKTKMGRVRLEDIKSIAAMLDYSNQSDDEEDGTAGKEPSEIKLKQELDDMYEQVKDKLEKKNTTFESIIFEQLKYMPNQFINAKGIQQIFEKLQIILSKQEAENILGDLRHAFNNRFECSFKDFIEFMTRKRINSTFFDKGFVDPMIAQCCQ